VLITPKDAPVKALDGDAFVAALQARRLLGGMSSLRTLSEPEENPTFARAEDQ
jgi:hypothetical protein